MPLAGGTHQCQGEGRLQWTWHGSQGQVEDTPWTTDSRGSEPGSLRWSDGRSGALWPFIFDDLCLIKMHKRWRRTPGGGCVPDCPGRCLGIIDPITSHHWCKEWTNYSTWQWLKRTESIAIAWTKIIFQLLRRHLFTITAVSIHYSSVQACDDSDKWKRNFCITETLHLCLLILHK